MNKPDNFMQLLECELERLHGRNHPLWDFWIEDHRNAIETMSNLFSLFIIKYLPNSSGMRCLNLGCGTGPASIAFAIGGNNVVGLDYKRNGLGLRLGKIRAKEHGANVDFVQGDGYVLPFKDESFDFVSCESVIEHVEKKDVFLKEMYRVLKPSGIGFITAPNRLWYREGHSGLLFANLLPHDLCERYVKWRGRRDRDDEWDVWHPTYWSLTQSLKRIGFEILANTIDYVTVYRFVKYKKIRPLLTPARYVAPLIFIVRKRI